VSFDLIRNSKLLGIIAIQCQYKFANPLIFITILQL